jgi:UDP-2,3-diacylglucosamine pyrophosphatase LpxH
MPVDDGRDIVIVSDFHMSSGYNRRTGTFSRNEDFFYDAAFARFIDKLIAQATSEKRTWRLVILGDFVDFLQVERPRRQHDGLTSSADTVEKLNEIARGHRAVFDALARFIDAGHAVDLVLGNHDIEFIWPAVQTRLKELIAERTSTDVTGRIAVHPWIFYVPSMVYAEHGQQYDVNNSFATLMQPTLPDRPDLIELPLGSFFVLYLFNHIERLDPFADNIKPATRYLMWALRTHPVMGLAVLGYHLQFFARILRKTSRLSAEQQQTRRDEYRRKMVEPYAAEVGLPPETLVEIDRLAAIPAMSNHLRQAEALLVRPLIPAVPVVAAVTAIYRATKRLRPGLRSLVMLAGGIAGLMWRERRLLRPATQTGGFLFTAARQIHELLTKANASVPAYVFGHTHTAEQYPLTDDDDGPRYLNTGTWTPLVPHAFDLVSTRERFSFVQITRDPANKQVQTALMIWNDAAERVEPLALLMM